MNNFVVKPRNQTLLVKKKYIRKPVTKPSKSSNINLTKNTKATTNGVGGAQFSGDKHERTKIISSVDYVMVDKSVDLKFTDKDPLQPVMLKLLSRKIMNIHKCVEKDRLEIQFRYNGVIRRYWGYICFNESDSWYSIYVEYHNGDKYTKLTWQDLGTKFKIPNDNVTISMWAKGILQK